MEIVTGLRKTPHISSNDMQSFQLGITGEDGAFPVGEIFRTELASNNELKVYDGEGVVGGVHFRVAPGTYDSITLENGSQGKKRKDLIVVRYTKSSSDGTENTEWAVKKGTETTGTPTAPAATTGDIRNGDVLAELPMFEIEYNGLNVLEVTEKFQTLMSLKELRELVGSLNSNMIIVQLYHASVNQSWLVVPNRSGYALVAAYNIRNDDQHGIKGIQKRTNGDYTVMFEQNPGGELDLWLVWAKIGTTES